MKIAIISSANQIVTKESLKAVNIIIKRLYNLNGAQIMTGGSLGVPACVIKKAKQKGIHTIAYSPDEDEYRHNQRYDSQKVHYFNEVRHFNGFTARSLEMIKDADCILVLNGRMGTLSEFAIALEEGKYVGVITQTGGISDHLEKITSITEKDFSDQVYFSPDPHKVIDYLINKNKKMII